MAEKKYMLDTNIASYVIRAPGKPLSDRLLTIPVTSLCVSAITHAELLYGVSKKPGAKRLAELVFGFLNGVVTLPFDKKASETFADLRSDVEQQGLSLGAMDMLIAAHALSVDRVLVTNDQAILNIGDLIHVEDWTRANHVEQQRD